MGCVTVLVQALSIGFQRRSQRSVSQRLNRSWVGAVIKEVVEWSFHSTSIHGWSWRRLCRVSSSETSERQGRGEFTRHSPELGIVPKPVGVSAADLTPQAMMAEQGAEPRHGHGLAAVATFQ